MMLAMPAPLTHLATGAATLAEDASAGSLAGWMAAAALAAAWIASALVRRRSVRRLERHLAD